MKKQIIFLSCIFLLSMIGIVSAKVDWTIPTEIDLNQNFQIKLFGDSM